MRSNVAMSSGGVPKGIAAIHDTVAVVATANELSVIVDGVKASSIHIPFTASCITVTRTGNQVAVGGEVIFCHFYMLCFVKICT